MKSLKLNNLLIISSLIVLIIYSLIVINELLGSNSINMSNLTLVFGNVIVTTIFILDKASMKDFKLSKPIQYLLRFLIIYSTVFSGILLNELINVGFLQGEELFWQAITIFMALGSFVLIQTAQQKKLKS